MPPEYTWLSSVPSTQTKFSLIFILKLSSEPFPARVFKIISQVQSAVSLHKIAVLQESSVAQIIEELGNKPGATPAMNVLIACSQMLEQVFLHPILQLL